MLEKKRKQLFVLHFAGGNRYSLRFIEPYLKDYFELFFLELPGRGKRIDENLVHNIDEAIHDYYTQIRALRNNEAYCIYGHSLGGLLSFWVALEMEKVADPALNIIASGSTPPSFKTLKKRHLMNDDLLKKELMQIGGMEKEVLENKELFNFFSPIIRADFQMIDEYEYLEKDIKISSDIYVVMGDQEESVTAIKDWGYFTSKQIECTILPGGHFFIYDQIQELSKIIKKSVELQTFYS